MHVHLGLLLQGRLSIGIDGFVNHVTDTFHYQCIVFLHVVQEHIQHRRKKLRSYLFYASCFCKKIVTCNFLFNFISSWSLERSCLSFVFSVSSLVVRQPLTKPMGPRSVGHRSLQRSQHARLPKSQLCASNTPKIVPRTCWKVALKWTCYHYTKALCKYERQKPCQ